MMDGCKLPENNCSPTLITFMEKVMEISGLGDRTYFHDGTVAATHLCDIPELFVSGDSM